MSQSCSWFCDILSFTTILNLLLFCFLMITEDVGEGNVDIGITGMDVVEESNVDVATVLVSIISI